MVSSRKHSSSRQRSCSSTIPSAILLTKGRARCRCSYTRSGSGQPFAIDLSVPAVARVVVTLTGPHRVLKTVDPAVTSRGSAIVRFERVDEDPEREELCLCVVTPLPDYHDRLRPHYGDQRPLSHPVCEDYLPKFWAPGIWQRLEPHLLLRSVFASKGGLADRLIKCATLPSHGSDHTAIYATFDVAVAHREVPLRRNFRDVDWKEFPVQLEMHLAAHPLPQLPLSTRGDVDEYAESLTRVFVEALEEHVPLSRPSPQTTPQDCDARRAEQVPQHHPARRARALAAAGKVCDAGPQLSVGLPHS
ncbi:hypothetical protein B0H14DRAFT_2671261 [Mycena olivaceomarginata]|nr:hypothetical protein B0H14DRAFT_2671261 [Mycena olivaceomarginata]